MTSTMILWAVTTYFIASLPFAVVLGRLFHGVDIRDYGDGNPGATNLKRATGSMGWFIVAVVLDGAKGLFPVGIPYYFFGWDGIESAVIATAAIAGHAFPIYLRFRGGKAVAITGGVWIGLIVFEAALVVPLMLVYWYMVVEEDGWAVLFMLLSLLGYLLLTRAEQTPLLLAWLGNFIIVALKHRDDLVQRPTLKRPAFLGRSVQEGSETG